MDILYFSQSNNDAEELLHSEKKSMFNIQIKMCLDISVFVYGVCTFREIQKWLWKIKCWLTGKEVMPYNISELTWIKLQTCLEHRSVYLKVKSGYKTKKQFMEVIDE